MGLESLVSTVLTKYKADTSDMKAQIRGLRGEQRAHHQQMLAESEEQNRKVDGQIKMWGKLALGVGTLVGAYATASKAAKAYLEDVRLESAAAGANIKGLQAATRGLVESDTLLAFAGKSMHGVWKLNQAEMERVLQGATALQKTMGVELQPTIEALTDAVTKGNTRALKEFGIEAKDKIGVLAELDKAWQQVGGNAELAGDDMRRAGVSMADTFDEVQGEFGKLAIAMTPAIEAFSKLISLVPQFIDLMGELVDDVLDIKNEGSPEQQVRSQMTELHAEAAIKRGHARPGPYNNLSQADIDKLNREADDLDRQANDVERRLDEQAKAKGRLLATKSYSEFLASFSGNMFSGTPAPGGSRGSRPPAQRRGMAGGDYAGPPLDFSGLQNTPGNLAAGARGAYQSWSEGAEKYRFNNNDADQLKELQASSRAMNEEYLGAQSLKREGDQAGMVSKIFGTPVEIEETTLAIEAATAAFSTMTSAAAAGFDAWITGSKSIGKAMNEAIAESLRGLATQMLVEAMKHTAFGIGAAAFGWTNPALAMTASEHFAAAAAFTGVAVAAGVGAKALGASTGQWKGGGGGAVGRSAGGGAPSVVGSGRSRDQSDAPVNIYVGSEWAGLSAMQQSNAIFRAIEYGKRGSQHIRRN